MSGKPPNGGADVLRQAAETHVKAIRAETARAIAEYQAGRFPLVPDGKPRADEARYLDVLAEFQAFCQGQGASTKRTLTAVMELIMASHRATPGSAKALAGELFDRHHQPRNQSH